MHREYRKTFKQRSHFLEMGKVFVKLNYYHLLFECLFMLAKEVEREIKLHTQCVLHMIYIV